MPLTAEQKLASNPDFNVWVTANAGTGKTKVLTDRYIRLLLQGNSPESILCVTFTNAAAGEMKERVLKNLREWNNMGDPALRQLLASDYEITYGADELQSVRHLYYLLLEDVQKLNILTIHSFCHKLLTLFSSEAGLRPGFSLMSDLDREALLNESAEVVCQRAQDRKEGPLYHALVTLSEKYTLTYIFSKLLPPLVEKKKIGTSINTLFHEETQRFSDALNLVIRSFNSAYDTLKQQYNLIDFDDLIVKAETLLTDREASGWVRYKLDKRIDHVLVDEAQDTNPRQWKIIDALIEDFFAGESARNTKRTIFVVGDEKQSIYGFQGSRPDLFSAQQQKVYTNSIAKLKHITLQDSFRSAQPIMDIVNSICTQIRYANNMHRTARSDLKGAVAMLPLIPEIEKSSPPSKPVRWEIFTEYPKLDDAHVKLAKQIASLIAHWLNTGKYLESRQSTIRPQDIMILFKKRVTGDVMKKVAGALHQEGIATIGADRIKLSDHILFSDIKRLLMFFHNPDDCFSLACVIKSPVLGLSDEHLATLRLQPNETLYAQLAHIKAPPYQEAYKLLERCMDAYHSVPPHQLIYYLFETLGMKRSYQKKFGAEINELLLLLYENMQQTPELVHIDALISYFDSDTELKKDPNASENAVRLSTIHNAKGLQAPIIILADATDTQRDVAESIYWEENTPLLLHDKDKKQEAYLKQKEANKNRALKEEERLLYVALTRAEEELYIGGIQRKSGDLYWYGMVEKALQSHDAKLQHMPPFDEAVLIHTDKNKTSVASPEYDESVKKVDIPKYLTLPIQNEKASISAETNKNTAHPKPNFNAKLGSFIHKLLELNGKRAGNYDIQKGVQLLHSRYFDQNTLSEQELVSQVTAYLSNSTYQAILKQDGDHKFEVTLYEKDACDQYKLYRIDHLIFSKDTIKIIDYKTGKPYVDCALPEEIYNQMYTYYTLLQKRFKNKNIEVYIFWLQIGQSVKLDFEGEELEITS